MTSVYPVFRLRCLLGSHIRISLCSDHMLMMIIVIIMMKIVMILSFVLQVKPQVNLLMIGETIDGHDLDLLQLGTHGPGKPLVWIIARQHPGEGGGEGGVGGGGKLGWRGGEG